MCEHLHKCHTNLILNKAMCIDSLIAINSLNLAAFPAYGNAMNKGKAAKLKTIYYYQRIYTHCFIENQICVAFMKILTHFKTSSIT